MNSFRPKARKTGAFIQNPKEKHIFDAQNYEIDKKQIYDIYKISPKKENIYNVIKKQVAFGKDIAFKQKSENKKFNNYIVFRDYMQKELDIDDIKSDIEQVKSLINLSENTRYKFYSYFRLDRNDFIKTNETSKFINIKKKPEKMNSINNNPLPKNDFLRKCVMLRRKRDEDDLKEKQKTFTIYSDLNIQSSKFDAINFLVNKNKLSEKYYEQKQKLIRCYNREEQFINYTKLVKQSVIQEAPDNINKNIKDKYSSKYFDAIYDKREEANYERIDQFFARHEITNYKLKNEESDFYGKIYGILCKNNYLKFLSYLYSKNEIFKFIYDQFSDKDATYTDTSLEESFLENIKYKYWEKSFEEKDEFFGDIMKQKELGENLKPGKKTINIGVGIRNFDEIENKEEDKFSLERKNNLMKLIFNNYVYIKIGFIYENIDVKYISEFFENTENEEDEFDEENKKQKKFYKYLKKCAKEPLNNTLLISSKRTFMIMDNKLDNIFKQNMNMSDITFVKIKKDILKSILNNKVKSLYPELLPAEFYLFQYKSENGEKENYLIKIQKKDTQLFDKQIADNNFSLIKIMDFIKDSDTNKSDQKKEKEKENKRKKEKTKEKKKEKEEEKEDQSTKKEIDEKIEKESDYKEPENKNKIIEIKSDDSEKSEKKEIKQEQFEEKQFAPPSSFNQDEIESEKYSASILNDESGNKMEDLIRIENIKKISEYQREHKFYEFIIKNEKYYFDIYQGQLRFKVNNEKNKSYGLKEIFPEKVEEDKEHSCYRLDIKRKQNLLFRLLHQDKNYLDNFYADIIKTKQQFGYE